MRLLLKNEADCLIRQHKPSDRPLPDLQRRTAAPYRANALNLSPTASSEFVREMEVGLGFSGWSWIGT